MNIINCINLCILMKFSIAMAPIEIVFFIQNTSIHSHRPAELGSTRSLKDEIIQQRNQLKSQYLISVYYLNEILADSADDWTIHFTIQKLINLKLPMQSNEHFQIISDSTRWIIFCQETTHVNVSILIEKLQKEDHTKPLYLGYSLHDREATIIHHFAFFEDPTWFPYPMLQAGVVFSVPLVKSIADVFMKSTGEFPLTFSHFTIDAAHELSRFIYDNVKIPTTSYESAAMKSQKYCQLSQKSAKDYGKCLPNSTVTIIPDLKTKAVHRKILLQNASFICRMAARDNVCAMHAQAENVARTRMTQKSDETPIFPELSVKRNQIYFAVKTCSKYHHERLPIIQSTWALYAKHIKYFSDTDDPSIPTINTHIPNADAGHCAKTLKILQLALRDIEDFNKNLKQHLSRTEERKQYVTKLENIEIKYLLLADDDTLLSVSGVCQILSSIRSSPKNDDDDDDADADNKIYLGERYGYRLHAKDGFNYITGGGGIIFSLSVVRLILKHCTCPSPTSPDDMILGSCLHSLQVKAQHSSQFHQARPQDYAMELLQLEAPISFHKFWQLDPLEAYEQWFRTADNKMLTDEKKSKSIQRKKNTLTTKNYDISVKKRRRLLSNDPMSSSMQLSYHLNEKHIDL